MAYAVFVEGLDQLRDFSALKANVKLAAVRAINRTTDRTRTRSAREIRRQVNFPAQYLQPSGKRLAVTKRAQQTNLEARITGRQRATSLARFVSGTPKKGAGVTVEVAPGRAKFMRRAFMIKLPQGSGSVDTKFNMGVAVRLRPGETMRNKREVVRMAKGLYLLYGPSVDQVFRTVAADEAPEAARALEAEFLRLLEL